MKKHLAGGLVFLMTLLVGNIPAFAAEKSLEKFTIDVELQSILLDQTYAEVPVFFISENAPGLFENGKTIYFQVDGLEFRPGLAGEVIAGDLEIGSIAVDGEFLSIPITKQSAAEKGVIMISGMAFSVPEPTPGKEYPLRLIREESEVFPNNLCRASYFPEQPIFIFSNFITTFRSSDFNDSLRHVKVTIPMDSMVMLDGRRPWEVSAPAYYSKEQGPMLPVRDMIAMLAIEADTKWDQAAKVMHALANSRVAEIPLAGGKAVVNGEELDRKSVV